MQTADICRLQTEGKMHTADLKTLKLNHFFHWELTVNRLARDQSIIQAKQRDIQASGSTVIWLLDLMSSLNNPVHS